MDFEISERMTAALGLIREFVDRELVPMENAFLTKPFRSLLPELEKKRAHEQELLYLRELDTLQRIDGVPVEFISMPLSGFMAPVTLVGTLIQHTAETLSGVVISQLATVGTSVRTLSAPDMRSIPRNKMPNPRMISPYCCQR